MCVYAPLARGCLARLSASLWPPCFHLAAQQREATALMNAGKTGDHAFFRAVREARQGAVERRGSGEGCGEGVGDDGGVVRVLGPMLPPVHVGGGEETNVGTEGEERDAGEGCEGSSGVEVATRVLGVPTSVGEVGADDSGAFAYVRGGVEGGQGPAVACASSEGAGDWREDLMAAVAAWLASTTAPGGWHPKS